MATHLLSKWGRTHCETTLIHDSFFFPQQIVFQSKFCTVLSYIDEFFSFEIVAWTENNEEDEEGALALANATEKALQLRDTANSLVKRTVKSGAEFLATRSYQGLEIHNKNSLPEPYLKGRSGRATGYLDEKSETENFWLSNHSVGRKKITKQLTYNNVVITFGGILYSRLSICISQEMIIYSQSLQVVHRVSFLRHVLLSNLFIFLR